MVFLSGPNEYLSICHTSYFLHFPTKIRQRPKTTGDSAVVFKTMQSAVLASKRSSAYEDLRVKAFLNALVAVGT